MIVKGIRSNKTTFEFHVNQIIHMNEKLLLITDNDCIVLNLKYNEVVILV